MFCHNSASIPETRNIGGRYLSENGARCPHTAPNLAAEFYVLSCLHRRGLSANLTLGNKKGVDIFVALDVGDVVTVEVKGVAGKYDWPASNLPLKSHPRHYVALVCFEGRISDESRHAPSVWIVPFVHIAKFKRAYKGGRTNVSRAAIVSEGEAFKNAWHLIEGTKRQKS